MDYPELIKNYVEYYRSEREKVIADLESYSPELKARLENIRSLLRDAERAGYTRAQLRKLCGAHNNANSWNRYYGEEK